MHVAPPPVRRPSNVAGRRGGFQQSLEMPPNDMLVQGGDLETTAAIEVGERLFHHDLFGDKFVACVASTNSFLLL